MFPIRSKHDVKRYRVLHVGLLVLLIPQRDSRTAELKSNSIFPEVVGIMSRFWSMAAGCSLSMDIAKAFRVGKKVTSLVTIVR